MAEELEQLQEENIEPTQEQDIQGEQVEQTEQADQTTPQPPSKASQLYNSLIKEGYTKENLFGSEENFTKIATTKEGASKLYESLKSEGYNDNNLFGGKSNFVNILVPQPPAQKYPTLESFGIDNKNFYKPSASDATYVAKQVTGEKIEQGEKYQKNLAEAIDNTTKRALDKKGIKNPSLTTYNAQKKKVEEAVKNGDAVYSVDPVTKTPALSQTLNPIESLWNSVMSASKAEDDANDFADMTPKQRVEFANRKAQSTPEGYVGEVPSGVISKITSTVGGAVPFMLKMGAGAAAGATAIALAPETLGASLTGLPLAMSLAFTTPDMVKQGGMQEVLTRFNMLKKQRPNESEEVLMEEAGKGYVAGAAVGGLTNLAFGAVGQAAAKPLQQEVKSVLGGILKENIKGTAKSAATLGTVSGAGELVKGVERGIENKQLRQSASKNIGDAVDGFVEGATTGTILHVATAVATGSLKVPGLIKSGIKYALSKENPVELATILKANEDAGKIPEGTTQTVMSDLIDYNDALSKTSQDLSPEAQASVAGLIQKRENLISQMAQLDPTQVESYNQQVESINEQIKNITNTGNPFDYEFNQVGQKLSEAGLPVQTETTKITEYDTENIPGLPSEIGGGQEPIQTQPIEGGGTQATSSGGVLQENVPSRQGEMGKEAQGEIAPINKQLNVIEENLNIGDVVTGNISGEKVTGKVTNVAINKGQIVVDITDQNGNERFLYSKNIENIKPKPKEIENLTPEQNKRQLELLNKEELTADELNELSTLGKLKRGEITQPKAELPVPSEKIQGEEAAGGVGIGGDDARKSMSKELDSQISAKENELIEKQKQDIEKAKKDLEAIGNGDKSVIEEYIKKSGYKLVTKEVIEKNPKSELLKKSEGKYYNSTGASIQIKTAEQIAIDGASKKANSKPAGSKAGVNQYVDAYNAITKLSQGKITAEEAKSIIEKAGLKTPKAVEDLLGKPKENVPTTGEKVSGTAQPVSEVPKGQEIKAGVQPSAEPVSGRGTEATTPVLEKEEKVKQNKDTQSEFITSNGRQKVNRVGDELVVTDAKTGEKVSRKTHNKAVREYIDNFDFTHGEEGESTTQSEDVNKMLTEVVESSNNPQQIAEIYAENDVPFTETAMTKDGMIAEYGLGDITLESYRRYGDINKLTRGIRANYFAKKGGVSTTIDSIAKEMSEHYFPEGDGTEITPNDIVDFMENYDTRKKLDEKFAPKNPLLDLAKEKFKKLTGVELTREVADKAFTQKIEKETQAEQNLLKQDYENAKQLEDEYWKQYEATDGFTKEASVVEVDKGKEGVTEEGAKVEAPLAENPFESVPKTQVARDKYFKSTFGENAAKAEEIYNKYKDTNDFEAMQKEMQGEKVAEQPPVPPVVEKGKIQGSPEELKGITMEDNAKRRAEIGMPERQPNPESVEQWRAEAEKKIAEGYNINTLIEKMERGDQTDKVENEISRIFAATLDEAVKRDPSNENINAYERLIKAREKSSTEIGRALRSLQGLSNPLENISDFFVAKKEANKVDNLTDAQKQEVIKDFESIQKAKEEYEKKWKEAEAKFAEMQAQNELLKQQKESKKGKVYTSEGKRDFNAERKSLKEELKSAIDKYKNNINKLGISSDGGAENFAITVDMAKIIGKIAKSHVEEVGAKLADVTKRTFDDVKDLFDGISEKDIHDVIAGKYSERKESKSELLSNLRQIQSEAKLLNELDKVLAGEPKSEKQKIEKNQKLADLRKQINEIKKKGGLEEYSEEAKIEKATKAAEENIKELEDKLAKNELDVTKAEKVKSPELESLRKKQKQLRDELEAKRKEAGIGKYSEEARAKRAIEANKRKEEKLKERIKNEDFESEEKKQSIYDSKEFKQKNPKLYKELLDSQIKTQEAELEFHKKLVENEMANMGNVDKFKNILAKAKGTLKAVFAGIDDSAVGVQNWMQAVINPVIGVKALKNHVLDFWSQKRFDRYLTELHNSADWNMMKESGLQVSEPKSLLEEGKEEMFPTRFKAIIKINGKEYGKITIGGKKYELFDVLKPFERAFTSLGNSLRVIKFRTEAEKMYSKGITFENNPEEFKKLATRINAMTSASEPNKAFKSDLLNLAVWSPRLMTSKLNLLGISDLASYTPVIKQGYYRSLGEKGKILSKQQLYAAADLAKFATSVVAGSYLYAAARGGKVNTNPYDDDFLDVKLPNGKSYNFTGGYSKYIGKIFQITSGGKVSRQTGQYEKYGAFKDRGSEVLHFMRGKMPPVTGSIVNLATGRDYTGKETSLSAEAEKYKAPMAISQIAGQIEKDGYSSLFMDGIPTFLGINVKDERDYSKPNPLFDKSEVELPEFKILIEKGIEIPSLGNKSKYKVDKDAKHPDEEMSDEEFDAFKMLVNKYMKEGYADEEGKETPSVKDALDMEFKVTKYNKQGEEEGEDYVIGKDLPKEKLKEQIDELKSKAVKKAKKEMGLISAKERTKVTKEE